MNKRIIVRISKTAEIKIEAEGYMGQSCKAPLDLVRKALGVQTDIADKPELSAASGVSTQVFA